MAQLLFDKLARTGIEFGDPPYAVNIGCWDGKSFNDPCYPLYESGFAGLAVEWGNPPELVDNLGSFPGVLLLPSTQVTAGNIAPILRRAECPIDAAFLKMDIDGLDASVLEAVLAAGFRPQVLQVEVNPEIPPPYSFTVLPSEAFRPGFGAGFFGMSLQYAVDLMARYSYALVELDFETEYTHDALFVRRDLLGRSTDVREIDARAAFLARPPLLPHIPGVTREVKESWRERTDEDAVLQEMWDALLDAQQRKLGNTHTPFLLCRAPHAARFDA